MAKRNAESEKKGRQHNNRLNRYSKQIDALYEELCAEASRLGVLADYEDDIDKIFSFDDYPAIRRRADELFNSFARKMEYTIDSGIETEWKASVAKNTAMVKQLLAGTTLSSVITDKFLPRNLEAVHAFQKRKVQGMGLSERVWNITKQARREMELAMDVALSDGRSAATLSRDVRHLLREPNKLFRRVRDKHGNLQLSKAAQAYHPGQGVYRSSARNAQRLARTEINMAYHEADSQYWSGSDIVLGIEIVLSNNHPIVDICDEFEGKQFPKWFKFTGWHPNCRCVAVPITPKREEMVDYLKRMARGEDVSNYQFSGVVNDLPDEFKQWMTDNADRLEGMRRRGKLPYFVKENGLYGEGGLTFSDNAIELNNKMDAGMRLGEYNVTSRTMHEIEQGINRYNNESHIFPDGVNVKYRELEDGTLAQWNNGTLYISNAVYRVEDGATMCMHRELASAFQKLRKGETMSFQEEYALEALYHESVHARSIVNERNYDRGEWKIIEAATQLTARNEFAKVFDPKGKILSHVDDIMLNGYGYQRTCKRVLSLFQSDYEQLREIAFKGGDILSIMNRQYEAFGVQDVKIINKLRINLME